MKRTFITLSVVVFVVGCATRSILVGDTPKPISEANPEEWRLVEIARQARDSTRGRERTELGRPSHLHGSAPDQWMVGLGIEDST